MASEFQPPCRCGAEHDPSVSPCRGGLVGRTLRAGIRVLERLYDSPFGEVYRAEHPSGLEVAVLLLGTAATQSVALAAQCLRRAIQIQHPNLAAIYAVCESRDGLIYAVAESIRGELLSETLSRRGALPEGEAFNIIRQAAAGLQAAHAAGWIHGNVSPEAILLGPTAPGTLVKLIRFTPECLTGQQSDPPIQPEGSLDYASPERLAGHQTDQRSDVYSLGAVLFHVLAGVPPMRAGEGGGVPDSIRPVLDRALAPSPAERYQTVAEFAAAIPPPAEPVVHLIPQPTRSARRNLGLLGAAAAALVVLSAGLWLLWGTQRLTLGAFTRSRAEESAAVARAAPEPSSASPSTSLRPARRPADSLSKSPVRRESVGSGRPTVPPHAAAVTRHSSISTSTEAESLVTSTGGQPHEAQGPKPDAPAVPDSSPVQPARAGKNPAHSPAADSVLLKDPALAAALSDLEGFNALQSFGETGTDTLSVGLTDTGIGSPATTHYLRRLFDAYRRLTRTEEAVVLLTHGGRLAGIYTEVGLSKRDWR